MPSLCMGKPVKTDGRGPFFFVSVFSFHAQRDMCFNDGSNINDPETQTAVVGADRVDMEM